MDNNDNRDIFDLLDEINDVEFQQYVNDLIEEYIHGQRTAVYLLKREERIAPDVLKHMRKFGYYY
jgi:hypothetical protein